MLTTTGTVQVTLPRSMARLIRMIRARHKRRVDPSMVMIDAETVDGGRFGPRLLAVDREWNGSRFEQRYGDTLSRLQPSTQPHRRRE